MPTLTNERQSRFSVFGFARRGPRGPCLLFPVAFASGRTPSLAVRGPVKRQGETKSERVPSIDGTAHASPPPLRHSSNIVRATAQVRQPSRYQWLFRLDFRFFVTWPSTSPKYRASFSFSLFLSFFFLRRMFRKETI